MKKLYTLLYAFLILAWPNVLAGQNAQSVPTVPRLVNYSGHVSSEAGSVVGLTFAIYKNQFEGAPLWMETQNVKPDAKGNYTVQLGATTAEGLPLDVFASGEARWLGVRTTGDEEQPRVLLLSVPYALKAADAQTLGGLPASAFVLAAPTGSNSSSSPTSTSPGPASLPNIGGSGTQNYIPIWTDNTGDLGNSILYQTGSGSNAKIGINERNPILSLDVNGSELVRGLFEMATQGYATKTKGFTSQPFNLESSAFNSSTQKYTLNHFQWQAEPTGNNTSTPGATLNLLYGTDPATPTETGLNIASNGQITFASGQVFPGTGTVTSVGTGAGLTGGPITGSGTLSVATGGITNAMLQNSSLTVTANSPLSGGGSISLGGKASLGLQPCSTNQILQFVGGAWVCANPSSGFNGIQEFTKSGTFTVPSGVTHLLLEMWGGGGGGGGGVLVLNAFWVYGSGGGAGGYTRAVVAVTPQNTYNVNIGAGGAKGTDASCNDDSCDATGGTGATGGESNLTDSSMNILASAAGGAGGGGATVIDLFAFSCAAGGTGGTGTSGPNSVGRTGGGGQLCSIDVNDLIFSPGAGGIPASGSIAQVGATGGAGDVAGNNGYILITY